MESIDNANMKNPFEKYSKLFSEESLWEKMKRSARQAGQKVIYACLLLYYASRRSEPPGWAKRIVLGTLGYFLAPIDAIPDLSPLIGYTDDLGVLSFGLATIAAYVNDEVRTQARERLAKWFDDYDQESIDEVEELL